MVMNALKSMEVKALTKVQGFIVFSAGIAREINCNYLHHNRNQFDKFSGLITRRILNPNFKFPGVI